MRSHHRIEGSGRSRHIVPSCCARCVMRKRLQGRRYVVIWLASNAEAWSFGGKRLGENRCQRKASGYVTGKRRTGREIGIARARTISNIKVVG